MMNVKTYGWKSENRSGIDQLVVNYTTKEMTRGYYLQHHTDVLMPTKKALDTLQESLKEAGLELFRD